MYMSSFCSDNLHKTAGLHRTVWQTWVSWVSFHEHSRRTDSDLDFTLPARLASGGDIFSLRILLRRSHIRRNRLSSMTITTTRRQKCLMSDEPTAFGNCQKVNPSGTQIVMIHVVTNKSPNNPAAILWNKYTVLYKRMGQSSHISVRTNGVAEE